jgi:hypothetical protein
MDNVNSNENTDSGDSVIQQFTNWLKTSAIEDAHSGLPSDKEYFVLSNKLSNEHSKISYEQYVQVRKECPESLRKYMKSSVFLQAAKNEHGEAISSEILM